MRDPCPRERLHSTGGGVDVNVEFVVVHGTSGFRFGLLGREGVDMVGGKGAWTEMGMDGTELCRKLEKGGGGS